ncbi:MAG: hypothetical protein IKC09_00620 [Oscillospiraceae bacterium]|nr:hypothetical protein [Oscillospiraceae bacterium]
MDIYFKTVAGALVAAVLCLTLAKQGKEFSLLLLVLVTGMITVLALEYLDPVMAFFRRLEDLIGLDSGVLRILLKIVGISVVGETAGMICADSGNGALAKGLQFLTGILVLWLSLPMLEGLLELMDSILRELG